MKLNALLVFCCVCLSACVAPQSTPIYTSTIEVTSASLPNYWVSQTRAFMLNTSASATPAVNGAVTLRYLIDKQGNIQNATVVKSTPIGVWDHVALNALNNLRYTQAASNPNAIEVYVTTEMIFKGSK